MKDKISLVMTETGCAQGEAELALELCGYEVEKAVAAVPRLFQNIVVLKGKLLEEVDNLYGLFLAILNLKGRSLVRAKAVVSYNPAVYTAGLGQDWFEFEKYLYACRLWEGTHQPATQEVEQLLTAYFGSPTSASFYSETRRFSADKEAEIIARVLSPRFDPGTLRVVTHRDVLDMGQFQELRPSRPPDQAREARRGSGGRAGRRRVPPMGGTLVLRISLDGQHDGVPASELRAGDLVYAHITDPRDIAQYLAKFFVPTGEDSPMASVLVPVEAVEVGPTNEIGVRVRFSLGVCGDVNLPPDIRLKVARRAAPQPWWKKLFG